MRVDKDTFIDSIDFNPATVLRALKNCKHVNNACDLDGFTTFAVKTLMYNLVNPLCVLFQLVFSTNSIPACILENCQCNAHFLKRHIF